VIRYLVLKPTAWGEFIHYRHRLEFTFLACGG
jgi:hypothetical protein